MSLLTDRDYFLQSLRLAFLRLDAPLGTLPPTSLVQSAPIYALSQHAVHAGLHPDATSDFAALSRSPGPVPSTSSSSPYPLSNPPGRPPRRGQNGTVSGPGNSHGNGASGLRYSETIVGKQGGHAAASTGASAGLRTRGKRSSWKPKPHHLEASDASTTPRRRFSATPTTATNNGQRQLDSESRASTVQIPPHLTIDSPGGTPQPGAAHPTPRSGLQRPSMQRRLGRHGSDDDSEDDDEGDNDNGRDRDRLPSRSYLDDAAPLGALRQRRPDILLTPLDAALSEQLVHHPLSPTESSYGGDSSANSQPDTNPDTTRNSSNTRDSTSASGDALSQPSLANSHDPPTPDEGLMLDPSPVQKLVRPPRPRADTGTSSDLPMTTASEEVDSDSEYDDHHEDDDEDEMDMHNRMNGMDDDEEDTFEFSLHGREGTTSSFGDGNASSAGAGVNADSNMSTLVSPPNQVKLPAISEIGEGDLLELAASFDNHGHPATPLNAEDAALKAAQAARRRARRRVNISGRLPIPLPLPDSPTGQPSTPGSGTTSPPRVRSTPQSPSTFMNRPILSPAGSSIGVGASTVVSAPANALPAAAGLRSPLSPPLPVGPRPLSPALHLGNQLLRPRSSSASRVRTRQRSKTDPVGQMSLSLSTPVSPASPTRSRDRTSSLRNVMDGSDDGPTGTQSLTSSPSFKHDNSIANEDEGELTEPVKPHLLRSKSAGNTRLSSSGRFVQDVPSANLKPVDGNRPALPPPMTPTRNLSMPSSPRRTPSRLPDPYLTFPIRRKEVPPVNPPVQSALSRMLKATESGGAASNNPFNEFYGALFGPNAPAPTGRYARRGGAASSGFSVTIYFPFSTEPHKPIKMSLKPDLRVEEVIGCALWKYWEAERKPSLCPAADGKNDDKWDERSEENRKQLHVYNWIIRIADEDEDGEIDDDYPAPDRSRAASGFGTCFAVTRANDAQARANQSADSQLERRPSRVIKKIERVPSGSMTDASALLAPPHMMMAGGSLLPGGSAAGSVIAASFNAGTPSKASLATAGGMNAPLVYLRVKIPLKGLEAVTTTVQVPRDMYLADVLDLICRKKFLENPKDWLLMVPDRGLIVPLDRTVESLQGVHQLALTRKSALPHGGLLAAKAAGLANTNPNASIFKRLSEPPQPKYVSSADLNTNYRTYTVQRKMPMPLGRHERILSIDNDYIHIMPSDTKLVSGTVRTASYHISQIASCKVSKRAPSNLKIVVWRDKDKDVKRYDFEAANYRMAAEIAQTIQALMQAWRESSAVERERQAAA